MLVGTCRVCPRDNTDIDDEKDSDFVIVQQPDGVFKYHKECAEALPANLKA